MIAPNQRDAEYDDEEFLSGASTEEPEEELLEELDEDELAAREEEELARLSSGQRWLVWGVFFASTLIFSLIFAPYDEILRYAARAAAPGMQLDYSALNLNLFGNDEALDFRVSIPQSGLNFRADRVVSGLSWIGLASNEPRGKAVLEKLSYSSESVSFEAEQADLDLDLELSPSGAPRSGQARIEILRVRFLNLPVDGIPMLSIAPEDFNADTLTLQARIQSGLWNLEGTGMNGSLFSASVSGTIEPTGSLLASRLNVRICVRPRPELGDKRPALLQAYLFGGGAMGGELCLQLTGPLGRPQVEREGGGSLAPGEPTTPSTPPAEAEAP